MGTSGISLGAGSRVERFLSSPNNIETQKAISHNVSAKHDQAFLDRVDLIKSIDLADSKLDPVTIESTLKTILDKDLLSDTNKVLIQQDKELLQKLLLLANSSDTNMNCQTPKTQSISGEIVNFLIADKDAQEYLLNSGNAQKNLLNFTKILNSSSPEGRLLAVADFLDGLISPNINLNQGLDSFFTNLEKGQAGELGKQIKKLYEEAKIANELKSFLAVPEQYLGDNAEVQAIMHASSANKSVYERLSNITQKIMNRELDGLSNASFKAACVDLLSNDSSIRNRGKQEFAKEFHSQFEKTAQLVVNTKKIESLYITLKQTVEDGDLKKIILDRASETTLLSVINADETLRKMLSDNPITQSQLTEKHLPLLRVAIERSKLNIDTLEERLIEDLGKIAKANLSLKIPCDESLGAGIGSLMLTRLLEEDNNGETIFSKYRKQVPDDAIHIESSTLAAFVRKFTDQSLINTPAEFTRLKNTLLNINVLEHSGNGASRNIHDEINSCVDLISSSADLIKDFDTIALESQSAKTFLEKHAALTTNLVNLNDQFIKLQTKREYSPYLDLLSNSRNLDRAKIDSEELLLKVVIKIQEDHQNKEIPDDLKGFLDLVSDRLQIRKDLGLMFIQSIQEEATFQSQNGVSSPYNRVVNILNQNFRDYEMRHPVSLPSADTIIDLFTRISSHGTHDLLQERRNNLDDFQSTYHDFNQTVELLRNPSLNQINTYGENRDLIADEYARFTHILDRVLIRTDDVLSNQQDELINAELKKMSELNPDKQANYSLNRIVISILQLLSKSFQELIGDLNFIDQPKQGVISSYV